MGPSTQAADRRNETDFNNIQQPATQVSGPRMHKLLLYLSPQQFEEAYSGQFRLLDLLICVMIPFLIPALTRTLTTWVVVAIWYLVALLRGFHMGLLLLPTLTTVRGYAKSRYRLVFLERLLRQCALALAAKRNAARRADPWLLHMIKKSTQTGIVIKTLLVLSGAYWSFCDTFLLPLDILSQVVVNTVWFGIFFPASVCQVAYVMALLVASRPGLVWIQWLLESGICEGLKSLWMVVAAFVFGSNSSNSCSVARSTTIGVEKGLQTDSAALQHHHQQQQTSQHPSCVPISQLPLFSAAAEAVAVPAGLAPDLSSTAGRLVLALSTCFTLLMALFLPLYTYWRLERHLKSKWMVAIHSSEALHQQQQQQQPGQQYTLSPAIHRSSGGISSSLCNDRQGSNTSSKRFYTSPGVFPFFMQPLELCKLLVLSCAVCFVIAEVFVLLCVHCPAVAGSLWQQLVV